MYSSLGALEALRAFVQAHSIPNPNTGQREPIYFMKYGGGGQLQHHALGKEDSPDIDEALLMELQGEAWIDVGYSPRGTTLLITPTPSGRAIVEQHARIQSEELAADASAFLTAVDAQADSDAKLAWPAVRPVLLALRQYWEDAGYSQHGIQVAPLVVALPEEQCTLFAATLRSLIEADYVRRTSELDISVAGVAFAGEIVLTDRTRTLLDGWPGASPNELVENLLAVIVQRAAEEPDVTKKRRLERVADTVRELGTPLAGEVLARVLMGGGP